jgi:hypothetical protein
MRVNEFQAADVTVLYHVYTYSAVSTAEQGHFVGR